MNVTNPACSMTIEDKAAADISLYEGAMQGDGGSYGHHDGGLCGGFILQI